MSLEQIEHRGGRIDLSRLGGGWKAMVYLPGATLAERHVPHSMAPADRTPVLEEAMKMIDDYLDQGTRK
jgi:hypothetical protein